MQQLSCLYSFSPELKVLFSTIKEFSVDSEDMAVKVSAIDSKRLLKLAKFHRIRPLLLQYERRNASLLSPADYKELKTFVAKNSLKNGRDIYHVKKLLQKFDKAGIPAVIHKGIQYQFELYNNQHQRERGDIDMLVQRKSVFPALWLLKKEGFLSKNRYGESSKTHLLRHVRELLSYKYFYQLTLSNQKLLVDFQWGIKSGFHDYYFPYTEVFEKATQKSFFEINSLQINKENLFWLMVIHHGGKDQWMRLRHLADLTAFMNTYGNQLNWEEILKSSKKFRLHRELLDGFLYLKTLIGIHLPQPIEESLKTHQNRAYKIVFDIWENCSWGSSRFEFKSLYIRYLNQENRSIRPRYYFKYLQYLFEKKKVSRLPDRYTSIDFLKDGFGVLIKLLIDK